jgi:histidinol dehydrogenase
MSDTVSDERAVTEALFAVTGRLADMTPAMRATLFERGRASDTAVEQAVRAIIGEVRARGDAALLDMAAQYDGVRMSVLEVPRPACEQALATLDAGVRAALEQAMENIAAFHRAQLPAPLEMETAPGVRLGRRADPLRRVGVYAPGGRAAYPSSVLMGVVPARVAGVDEVIVCSPPGPDGLPPQTVLAACALAGAHRVFAVGGAGAVAAMAVGTAAVPRVDKIVGPGNAYVTEAKRQLNGVVAIDSPAGPSEVLVIGDGSADATLIAAELLAQAEHDPDAAAVLLSTSAQECEAVAAEVARLVVTQPRRDVILESLAARGALLHVPDMSDAVAFAEEYAPEHLAVMTADPRALLPALRAAGTIFLGAPSSVAFGDYITGANHVLPTAGLARACAGLSVHDFLRWTTYQELTPGAAASLAGPTVTLAEAEGLPAHALAARLRSGAADGPAATRSVQLREAYRTLAPYDPGRTPCDVDLSDNTNLFGAPPAALPALAAARAGTVTRYPSVYAPALKQALADMLDVEPSSITTGCGSDDLIDSAVRAFCETGAAVAYPDPTFGMVPIFATMNATVPVPVPLRPDFELDAGALLGTRAALTYLCRPNNPTGTAFDRRETERVCRDAAGVVLVDEAYADYADDHLVDVAVRSERCIVVRTLSKAFGLAGLRVGFAVGPAALIREVEKSRGPYKVSAVAEAAALAVLSGDAGWVQDRVREVRLNRDRLSSELAGRGVVHWPSAANFLLVQVPGSAADWNGRLRARGVAVRPFPQLRHGGECIRVSIGPWHMVQRFLDAFDRETEKMRGA